MDWLFESNRDVERRFPWISIPGVASNVWSGEITYFRDALATIFFGLIILVWLRNVTLRRKLEIDSESSSGKTCAAIGVTVRIGIVSLETLKLKLKILRLPLINWFTRKVLSRRCDYSVCTFPSHRSESTQGKLLWSNNVNSKFVGVVNFAVGSRTNNFSPFLNIDTEKLSSLIISSLATR